LEKKGQEHFKQDSRGTRDSFLPVAKIRVLRRTILSETGARLTGSALVDSAEEGVTR